MLKCVKLFKQISHKIMCASLCSDVGQRSVHLKSALSIFMSVEYTRLSTSLGLNMLFSINRIPEAINLFVVSRVSNFSVVVRALFDNISLLNTQQIAENVEIKKHCAT